MPTVAARAAKADKLCRDFAWNKIFCPEKTAPFAKRIPRLTCLESAATSINLTAMGDDPFPSKLPHPGGKRVKGQRQPDNVRYGNSRAYLEARLARDAEEGCREAALLLQGIRTGLISHYAAGVEMNYTRRREPNGRGSENASKRIAWTMHRLLNPRRDPKALIG